jgi:hypothetical protein
MNGTTSIGEAQNLIQRKGTGGAFPVGENTSLDVILEIRQENWSSISDVERQFV